jgi:hypothetical protein
MICKDEGGEEMDSVSEYACDPQSVRVASHDTGSCHASIIE